MANEDKTKELLEEMLKNLYSDQALVKPKNPDSYLVGGDGQFLGKITQNPYDNESILNKYGPYGSKYSPKSIFNPYSPYGSVYGQWSLNNPYCTNPPTLTIAGKLMGNVSSNPYVHNRISTEAFLYNLEHNLKNLLAGHIEASESAARTAKGESFIEAADGVFLGSLNPNTYDVDSIFNKFGTYGNSFSQTSIFNPYSSYGGQFSQFSPFNLYATSPPKVYLRGVFVAYLTVSSNFQTRINPNQLFSWASQNVMWT